MQDVVNVPKDKLEESKEYAYLLLLAFELEIKKREYYRIVKNLSMIMRVKNYSDCVALESPYAFIEIPKTNPDKWCFGPGQYEKNKQMGIA